MEPKVIPAITAKAKEYKAVQRQRIALLADEVKLKGQLVDLMHENKIPAYHDPDEEVKVILEPGKEKVKVKVAGDDNGEEEENEE